MNRNKFILKIDNKIYLKIQLKTSIKMSKMKLIYKIAFLLTC